MDSSKRFSSAVNLQRRRLCAALPAWGLAAAGGGALLSGCATRPSQAVLAAAPGSVPPFSQVPEPGTLPMGWVPYIIRRDRELTHYETAECDGRTVLHAVSDSARSGLHCPVNIDPNATPWLRWQWRVDAPCPEASVGDDDTEDTPARIVVAFDGDWSRLSLRDTLFRDQVQLFTGNELPYATLTYVWDGQLPVGEIVPYPRSSRIQYQVVESGTARQGQWLSYERNVVDDFKAVFGEAPGRIINVGLLTDSDDLKNRMEAWYGDISFQQGR
ncbi:MAG: DUF3047 domain-containing protein [Rubrivivax sp.]|nr:MAG: DUF3047 domain-containing protein [Rubrivivax sp.]